jgi:site-specific DNA-cytosine methylase
MSMKDVAIFLCDKTGIMAKPWADAGYECYCIDVQHKIRKPRVRGNITFLWGDVRTWVPPERIASRIAFLAAFPPCTHVTVAGARDFRTKGTALLRDSLEMFSACYSAARWCGARFMLENPVGKFSDHMQKPDYIFQPWEYGDLWTKKTCIWAGNGFVMPPKIHASPPEGTTQKIWLMSPSDERSDLRSETPPGFARAVFEANGSQLEAARLIA